MSTSQALKGLLLVCRNDVTLWLVVALKGANCDATFRSRIPTIVAKALGIRSKEEFTEV